MATLEGATVVVDCRWLGRGGAGTVTRLLLQGLQATPPPGRWVLWGDPAALADLQWPGAEVMPSNGDPGHWWGQRHRRRPHGDVLVSMHQLRPLFMRSPVVQFIYDTIPLRTAGSRWSRLAKRSFLAAVARDSSRLLTASTHSARCLITDLGARPERITTVPIPVDHDLQARVFDARQQPSTQPTPYLLCIAGRPAPHKNIPVLVEAFGRSQFAAGGGTLVIVGGRSNGEASTDPPGVNRLAGVDTPTLDHLLAHAVAVACPSTEEGFGLPVWEARCVGTAVVCSTGGSLMEVAGPDAVTVAAHDVAALADGIDAVALRGVGSGPIPTSPTLADMAAAVVAVVTAVVAAEVRRGPNDRSGA